MATGNSILDNLTPQDFKTQFFRGFSYVDNWLNTTTYNLNDKVFYTVNNKFYQSLKNTNTSLPTVSQDWLEINADQHIVDQDIINAYAEAGTNFPVNLGYINDAEMVLCFLYLTAHYLYHDLNANGLNGQGAGLSGSYSVGNVSEGTIQPSWATGEKIFFSFMAKSPYGEKYLNMIQPRSIGAGFNVVSGATLA